MGRKNIRCHGDETRFKEIADFVNIKFGNSIKYIADVAGGQGALSRILNKKYNYQSEVIDPREYQIVGINNRKCHYSYQMADYYDLIIGLHPDEATKDVVKSAPKRPILIIPCCNFWDKSKKLGTKELVNAICEYLENENIAYEKIKFNFKGPKNIGILTYYNENTKKR